MKSWLFLISFGFVLQIRAQISVYDCGAISQIVTQSEIEAADNEYYKQCIMFIPPETYDFNGNLNRKVTAATNIHLKEGVHIEPFTQDGQFWMQINPKSDFDVAVMNYENLNNVLKFEKLEFGVTLPQDVLTKVNNFVNEASVPEEDKLNPYLDWELRVYAEFSHPSLSQPIVIDGFYTKEFDVEQVDIASNPPINNDYYSDAEYRELGEYTVNSGLEDFPLRIRFAPPQIGNWTCIVKIQVEENTINESTPFIFKVVESGNEGYVKVGINKRYLRRGNQTFLPLGCNISWPEAGPLDSELWEHCTYWGVNEQGQPTFYKAGEGYKQAYVIPRVYNNYLEQLTSLSEGGGNYYRSIMYPSGTDIEWEELGNYTERLHMAQEMDRIIEHSRLKGLFIHFNMQIHYTFQKSANAYDRLWSWDTEMFGEQNCYRKLLSEKNPIEPNTASNPINPMYFLQDEDAKKYYKQRLRYILARWGYSTNIAVWELFSEISNVGAPDADNNDYYLQGNNWMIYRDWQVEMAEYLKSMYHGQCHLVTASYGGEKHPDDDTFESPHMDIMTSNIYDYDQPNFGKFWIDNVSLNYLNDNLETSYSYQNIKPMIFSEFDPINSMCDNGKVEWQRAIWQSVFSGLAGALSWDVQLYPQNMNIYGKIRTFIGDVDLDQGGWHPGASDQILGPNGPIWAANFSNNPEGPEKYMDGVVDPPGNDQKRIKKADLSYLRSGDGNFAIGVLTNKTYNVKSIGNCYQGIWPNDPDEPLLNYTILNQTDNSLKCKKEDLFVANLNHNGQIRPKYYLEYYNYYEQSPSVLNTQRLNTNLLQVKYKFNDEINGFVIPLKVRPKDVDFPSNIAPVPTNELIPYLVEAQFNTQELESENTSSLISIHPNPVQDILYYSIVNHNNCRIFIFSGEGRLILEKVIISEKDSVNVSHLSKGIYKVEIRTENETILIRKIIKI